jgi:adenylate cyclase
MRLIGFGRWEHNPAICTACIKKVAHRPGGSEIELSLLFADVRDSTALAENLRAAEFSQRMGRFYRTTARVVDDADGIVDKVMGDGIMALFVPGITGPDHASHAIRAGRDLLDRSDEHGLPVGAGVHTGIAYVGVIGEDEATLDFTALGDTVNTAARLGSLAAADELLVSDEAMDRSDTSSGALEHRLLDAKGKREPVGAWVVTPEPGR